MDNWTLPSGWKWIELGSICETTSGGTPSRRQKQYFQGDIPWVKSGELNDADIFVAEEKITEKALENSSAKIFPIGTLLMAMYGATVGKLGVLGIEAATNQAICAIFPSKYIDRDFIFWYMLSRRQDLIERSFGGAQPNISQAVIKNFDIPVPFPEEAAHSLSEQRRIVARIEALFRELKEMRSLQGKMVKDTDRLMDAVYEDTYPDQHSTLPTGWELLAFPEICEVNPRKPRIDREMNADTSFVPMAAVDEISGSIVDMQTRPYEEIRRGYRYFEENDVLFAKITPSMQNGKAAIARGLIDNFGLGSTEFHVFRPNDWILPEWIYHYVRRTRFRNEAMQRFRGAAGQQRVPKDFLKNHVIPVPFPDEKEKSLRIQRQITTYFESVKQESLRMLELANEDEKRIDRLEQAILSQAFRGEL